MTCEDCYWAPNCPFLGEICEDFYSIYDIDPQPQNWSSEDWATYVAEYGDGNIDYEEVNDDYIG